MTVTDRRDGVMEMTEDLNIETTKGESPVRGVGTVRCKREH